MKGATAGIADLAARQSKKVQTGGTVLIGCAAVNLRTLVTAWHYARGEALARQGNANGIRAEAAAILGLTGKLFDDDGSRQAQQLTIIARNVLMGRAAMLEKRPS